ncbi:MAG: phosphate acyltransferase PlsX [Nitrospirota bacterium]
MKIALDAMGGDNSPATEVEGAVLSVRECETEIILVGDEKLLKDELKKYSLKDNLISVVHAPQKIRMDESPSSVIRKKRDSSIWIATELVKNREASAIISAGNTGATMATSIFLLGVLKGIERPAIATILPSLQGTSIILDVGANVDCKPQQLLQFGIMGHEYAKTIIGKTNPTVGLLSIGEEDVKGNELTKDAFKMLKESFLNFIGNIEGKDVYNGYADVIVCDGFIGNISLKISEGLSNSIIRFLKREIERTIIGKIGYLLLKPTFMRFKKMVNYEEYGGAPLLGINGVSIICHGNSSGKAIKNAIKVALVFGKNRINEHIQNDIEETMELNSAGRL